MESRKCAARSKQSGNRCRRWATKGSTVCKMHGSAAPQVAAKAEERVTEDVARRTFGRLSEVAQPVGNPFAALSTLAGEVMAWKDFIAGRIAELDRLRYEGLGSGEQLNAEVALFERALDRCVVTMTAIAKLNLDEKAIRVSEAQVSLVEKALTASLTDVGLSGDEQRRVGARLAHHLRLVG